MMKLNLLSTSQRDLKQCFSVQCFFTQHQGQLVVYISIVLEWTDYGFTLDDNTGELSDEVIP